MHWKTKTTEPTKRMREPAIASVAHSKVDNFLNSSNGEGGGACLMIDAIILFKIIIKCYKYLKV